MPNRSNNIRNLKAHLNFAAMEEIKHEHGSTVVIPINNEFCAFAKIREGSILNLVALVNKDGNIRSMHLAIYTAPKGQQVTQLPASTFQNIFHTATNVTDGNYRFLTPAGTKEYQLDYRKGSLASTGHFAKNLNNGGIVQKNGVNVNSISCTDWYLVTTVYIDGVEAYQTSEYVGTTCSGCDDTNYEMLCDVSQGGGGGGNPEGFEYARTATVGFSLSTLFAIGQATTYGRLTLSFTGANNIFTAASAGQSFGTNTPAGWTYTHGNSSATILNTTTVSASGSGTFTDPAHQTYTSSKTQNFSYSIVFP